ncbi:ParB N-terminal domain-containing protein [Flavobacterium sedimenticola]|uniref:ParB N-terminal domain-containing protein n=1 Tax=Flavobacterium sedimenticola TaxID=3043286 RepID=A0ABT6XNW0_9FLAO|nr:ParB N-terminal domain-containing protein [Flavobacterium sedimenticola]MDI9256339.1 ParB N-terminal domain-containing protein [Flavobacterium sedimenticola]
MKVQYLKIEEVIANEENPRYIKEAKFLSLVKSLQDFPEMAKARPLIINQENKVLGGNMRLKAMQEAGWITVPVIKVDWSEEKQREFVIKDNASFGEWDWEILSKDWFNEPLAEFGLDIPAADYNPNLTPSFNTDAITPEDIDRAGKGLGVGSGVADTIEVICPDCGCEFHIKNS